MLAALSVKNHYARTLVEMSATQKLSQIKVTDLIARAGTARQTFYNHFFDLDDLICYTANALTMDATHGKVFVRELFVRSLERKQGENRPFFLQLPDCKRTNGYANATIRWMTERMSSFFIHPDMDERERQFRASTIIMYVEGYSGLLMHWYRTGMEAPIEVIADVWDAMMPSFVRDEGADFTLSLEDYPR